MYILFKFQTEKHEFEHMTDNEQLAVIFGVVFCTKMAPSQLFQDPSLRGLAANCYFRRPDFAEII